MKMIVKILIWVGCLAIGCILAWLLGNTLSDALMDTYAFDTIAYKEAPWIALVTSVVSAIVLAIPLILARRICKYIEQGVSKKKEAEIKARVARGETHHLRANGPADPSSQDQ